MKVPRLEALRELLLPNVFVDRQRGRVHVSHRERIIPVFNKGPIPANVDRVKVSKEAFERAFRCKEFLEGVPDYVLALKGANHEIINLIVHLLQVYLLMSNSEADWETKKAVKQQAMEMLVDELMEQAAVDKGDSRGYARRSMLTDELRAVVRKVKENPIRQLYKGTEPFMPAQWCRNVNRMLPDCCTACDGGGEVPKITEPKPGEGQFFPGLDVMTCPKCNGYGHTRFVVEVENEDTLIGHTSLPRPHAETPTNDETPTSVYTEVDFRPSLTQSNPEYDNDDPQTRAGV